MTCLVPVDYAESSFHDIRRLNDFLTQQERPSRGQLAVFIAKAVTVLFMQPGFGRLASDGLRARVIHRGCSGYLMKCGYQCGAQTVTILRIRHQSESGYILDEI